MQQRAKTAERGYGSRWQKASKAFLAANPLCCRCQSRGLVVLSAVTDHKVPHKGDWSLFWNRENWQPLCKTCHDSKTAREDGAFGNTKGEARASPECGLDGVPVDPKHHWRKG